MPSDPYGNITTSATIDPNWANITNTSNASNIVFDKQPRRIRLEEVDLTEYTEDELKGFAGLLEVYINEKYPPKPPKFKTIAESDAWMEKHYG